MGIESRIKLTSGDITRLQVNAVVTAANEQLCGGGGVDGAVHGAAGPELVAASQKLAPCHAGQSRITAGFAAKAEFVIHSVGPVYRGGDCDEAQILASSYETALSLAAENHVEHIAFPCISTGVFGFPHASARDIAIASVVEWLRNNEYPRLVTFCCFEAIDYELYQARLEELGLLN